MFISWMYVIHMNFFFFFFSSRRRHTRCSRDWSSDVCSSDLEKEPIRYFFCDLSPTHTLRRLVRIAKSRWKIEQDYLQLKDELGLDHYEGRNWAGWHHHVSMVMMAHAFLTLESLRAKKNFWVDPATDAT